MNKKGLPDLFAILRFECTLYVSSISLQGPFWEGVKYIIVLSGIAGLTGDVC